MVFLDAVLRDKRAFPSTEPMRGSGRDACIRAAVPTRSAGRGRLYVRDSFCNSAHAIAAASRSDCRSYGVDTFARDVDIARAKTRSYQRPQVGSSGKTPSHVSRLRLKRVAVQVRTLCVDPAHTQWLWRLSILSRQHLPRSPRLRLAGALSAGPRAIFVGLAILTIWSFG